jgi:hypothetical protein
MDEIIRDINYITEENTDQTIDENDEFDYTPDEYERIESDQCDIILDIIEEMEEYTRYNNLNMNFNILPLFELTTHASKFAF